MKYLALLGLLVSVNSYAAGPNVNCTMYHSKVSPMKPGDESSYAVIKIDPSSPSNSAKLGNFVAKVEMAPVFTHAGLPKIEGAYDLSISIKTGRAETGLNLQINEGQASERLAPSLTAGEKIVYMNCDINE